MTFELWLCIGVLFFYAYDATIFLYSNEVVFTLTKNGWRFRWPKTTFTLSGRTPYIAPVFMPFRPRCYLYSRSIPDGCRSLAADDVFIANLQPITFVAMALMFSLFLVMPCMLYFSSSALLLSLFVVVYAMCAMLAMLIVMKRQSLGMTRRECVSICIEIVLCPPFAMNVVQRLSQYRYGRCNLLAFAEGRLSSEGYRYFVSELDVQRAIQAERNALY